MSSPTFRPMTDAEVREMHHRVFGGESVPPKPPCEPVPDNVEYETVTNKVVEVSTPTSRTRFHAPNDKVEFEREKYEDARHERQVQGVRVHFPNSRFR